jgi:signal transduction histidine kinase
MVEDEPQDIDDFTSLIRGTSYRVLTGEDWDSLEITVTTNQADADQAARLTQYHVVLVDLRYPANPGEDPSDTEFRGMLWLPELRKLQPGAAIVILTAYPDVPTAVKAVRDYHANDFVAKTEPFDEICARIRTAWQSVQSFKQAESLRQEYWMILRSQALRVHVGEVAKEIRRSRTALDTIASRIESGDPTAVKDAPAQIRSLSHSLWNGFRRTTDWLREANEEPEGASPRLSPAIDLVRELINPLPKLYGGEIDISETTASSIELGTYPADLKISLHEVIRNALEAGATRVKVRADKTVGGATIVVKDNGPGLPADSGDSLFQKGFTTHKNDPRHQGMGLYIASRLMQDLGGTIDIRTADEGGVIATLNIPDLGGKR